MDVNVQTKYDINSGKNTWVVSCPEKREEPFFIVSDPRGYLGFVIMCRSAVPQVLEGAYIRQPEAVEAIKNYFRTMPQTHRAKNNERAKKKAEAQEDN